MISAGSRHTEPVLRACLKRERTWMFTREPAKSSPLSWGCGFPLSLPALQQGDSLPLRRERCRHGVTLS